LPEANALDDTEPRDKRERNCVETVDLLAEGASKVDRREETEHRPTELREEIDDRGLTEAHGNGVCKYVGGRLKRLSFTWRQTICSEYPSNQDGLRIDLARLHHL